MPTLTYATIDQFKANPDAPSYLADELITARLAEAERDIDGLFAGRRIDEATGRRWKLSELPAYKVEALADVTVQQAIFRVSQGAAYFAGVDEVIQGPDYTVERKSGRQTLSPVALAALRLSGLISRGGRAHG